MRSRQQSIGKEAPTYPENEDRWRADDKMNLWAVADGAGGTGIYAGEWAHHLVRQVPTKPFGGLPDLASWLNGHWEDFFSRCRFLARANYLINYKLMHEGSGATLATLHARAGELQWSLYGDAVALCFQPDTNELWSANPDIRQFACSPYLINWLAPLHPDGFRTGVWIHRPNRQYALLSDALGQYILMAHASLHGDAEVLRTLAHQPTALGSRAQAHVGHWSKQGDRFGEAVWGPLRAALVSPESFLHYTRQLRTCNLLGADDYTCILIED